MSSLLQDLRHTFRMLTRQPGFSAFVVLTLAIGVGANTAVFSIVNGVLLKPLPYPESDRLVSIIGRFDPESGFNFPEFPLSPPEFLDYRAQAKSMEDVAAFARRSINVGGGGIEPERVVGAAVSANFFRVMKVAPLYGRTFSDADDTPKAPPTAVLSLGYWQSSFGGDRGVVGRTVLMNGAATTVIGVVPEGFTYPGTTTRIWMPLRIDPANPASRRSHGIRAIGRIAAGSSFEAARVELAALMAAWKAQYPDVHTGHYLFIRPLLEDVAGPIQTGLLLLLGATGFVLLIVCANVANVVLARGEARVREMAIRGALGAGRTRLIRLSLVESTVLGAIGGLLGVACAYAAVRALIALDPGSIPRAADVAIDGRMLVFAAGVSLVSVVLFGLVPALRGASTDLQPVLRDSTLSASGSSVRVRLRQTLVAAEVALAVVLVVGAGLMLRSIDRLFAVDPGFRADGLVMTAVSLPAGSYPEPQRVLDFYGELLQRVRALPGITHAATTSGVPLWSDAGVWDFDVEGRPAPAPGAMAWNAGVTVVSPGFFETLGMRLVRGRYFAASDGGGTLPVAAINETMAARFFPGEDPIGRRIRVTGTKTWLTIVGIVGDIRDQALDQSPRPVYYLVDAQMPVTNGTAPRALSIIMRVAGPADTALAGVRSIVRTLDPNLPVFDVQTLNTIVDRTLARPRFLTTLLSVFALIGLVLGASGIYGVLAYTVSRRTQELGIRRALGAPPSRLLRDVLVQGMVPVALGLLAGLGASLWTSTFLRSQLFGISRTDGFTYAAVVCGVIVVAIGSCLIPARRALAISPIAALRTE